MKQQCLIFIIIFGVFLLFYVAIDKFCFRDEKYHILQETGRGLKEISIKYLQDYSVAMSSGHEKEYHIQWQEGQRCYTSYNSKQRFTIGYFSKGFSFKSYQREVYRHGTYPKQFRENEGNIITLPGVDFHLSVSGYGKGAVLSSFSPHRTVASQNRYFTEDGRFGMECINQEAGLRQNFYVLQKPEGSGNLQVHLEVKGLELKADSNKVVFSGHTQRLTYSDLHVWDACGDTLPAYFIPSGDNAFAIEVNDASALYPITIDPIVVNDSFSGPDWIAECNIAYANMGRSVSSAGDVNGDGYDDIIAGAGDNNNGSFGGAAFVYYGSGSGMDSRNVTVLKNDQYREEIIVSAAGDVNGDGFDDVMIGASHYSNGEQEEGAVFLFHGSASGIGTAPAEVIEGNQPYAHMGASVSTAGDVNGDGYSDVMAGAADADNGEADEGIAYIYLGAAGGIEIIPATVIEGNQGDAHMGTSVATAGDVNKDGYSDVLFGSALYDDGHEDEGAVSVYYGSAEGVVTTEVTTIEGNYSAAHLGDLNTISSAGDINGDGYNDIVFCMPGFVNNRDHPGGVMVYYGSVTGINAASPVFIESRWDALVICSVYRTGDVNGDGYDDLLMSGSIAGSGSDEWKGGALLCFGAASGISSLTASTLQSQYLAAMAGAGDINGDAVNDILFGIGGYSNGEPYEGALFLYYGLRPVATSISGTVHAGNEMMHTGGVVAIHLLTGKQYKTLVNSNGAFVIDSIPKGLYIVKALPEAGGFLPTYYPDYIDSSDAYILDLEDQIWDIDLYLALSSSIRPPHPWKDFHVFPNPCTNELVTAGTQDIEIADLRGTILFRGRGNNVIETGIWKPGIYIIKARDGQWFRILKAP